MFSSVGLFKRTPCPKGVDCDLLNCIFNHGSTVKVNSSPLRTEEDPVSLTQPVSPPPAKRRKLDNGVTVEVKSNNDVATSIITSKRENGAPPVQQSDYPEQARQQALEKDQHLTSQQIKFPVKQDDNTANSRATVQVKTLRESIAPPPITRRQSNPATKISVESLQPRTTNKQPVLYSRRDAVLKKFHKVLELTNDRMSKKLPKQPEMKMTAQEVITQALDDEEYAANTTSSADAYQAALSNRIVEFNNMTPATWVAFMLGKWRKSKTSTTDDAQLPDHKTLDTGLNHDREIVLLRRLRTPIEGLEAHGYVTAPPTEAAILEARAVLKSMGNWEVCDRCNTRFQVFPGRKDDGSLVSKGLCRYHWARSVFKNRGADQTFPCCGLPAHIGGCTVSPTHVFKVNDKNRLATIMQFERTPEPGDGKVREPVTFDCEMVYTTNGMELARLTALSWPDKRNLLDILVRPYGEILDFNTRFSGLTAQMFSGAQPYSEDKEGEENGVKDGERGDSILRLVDSPAAARALLFNLLDPNTPLIGHAIDNDLTVTRIIHPFIIDTVLLYPHPKGLPIRYKLKDLTARYLQRDIQTGGAAGHDSKEDSEATSDLVLTKVRNEWRVLQGAGWTWNGNKLVAPLVKVGITKI